MSEWWTYGPRDLLMFSAQTYYRLFDLYNRDLWPLQMLALVLGVAVLALWRRGGDRAGRAIAVILAMCWLWVAWGFHWQRYASINLVAGYFALAFVVQALLLLWLGGLRGRLTPVAATRLQQRAGLGLLLFAQLMFPLIGPLLGRSGICRMRYRENIQTHPLNGAGSIFFLRAVIRMTHAAGLNAAIISTKNCCSAR
jgi:hypothetical protein